MNCLITGATGFVGTYLTDELKRQGISYIPVSRREFDLLDLEGMERFFAGKTIDHVIHLAGAVGSCDKECIFEANIVGLYYLLRVCVAHDVQHFTFASGNAVYGTQGQVPWKENMHGFPEPKNLYALSKYAGELIVSDFCAKHEIGWANVRIGDIYGPEQKTGNLVKAVVNSAAAGNPLKLYGAGVRKRDYIYVTDAARGLAFISIKGLTGAINLGTGIGTTVAEVVNLAAEISGISEIQSVDTAPEDVSQIFLDVTLLRQAGFSTEVSLRKGLKKCIEKKVEK